MQDIQLGGENIQVTFSCILDLDIVFHHTIHFHLLDATVHAQPVVFMNHKVSYGKLRKALDLVSAVLGFFRNV